MLSLRPSGWQGLAVQVDAIRKRFLAAVTASAKCEGYIVSYIYILYKSLILTQCI